MHWTWLSNRCGPVVGPVLLPSLRFIRISGSLCSPCWWIRVLQRLCWKAIRALPSNAGRDPWSACRFLGSDAINTSYAVSMCCFFSQVLLPLTLWIHFTHGSHQLITSHYQIFSKSSFHSFGAYPFDPSDSGGQACSQPFLKQCTSHVCLWSCSSSPLPRKLILWYLEIQFEIWPGAIFAALGDPKKHTLLIK